MKTLSILSFVVFMIFYLGCRDNESSKDELNLEKNSFTTKDSTVSTDTILSYKSELEHQIHTWEKEINSSVTLFHFNLFTSTDTFFITYDSLLITSEKDNKIQTIYFTNIYEGEEDLSTAKIRYSGLDFIDLNFDGYLDLDLFISAGATGNYHSLYWLFDPNNNLFIFNEKLSNLVSVHVDTSKKLVYSSIEPGDFYEYVTETYQYINGNLTLIRQESFLRAQGKKYHEEKIYERKQGKLKLISNKHTKIEGYDYDWYIKNNF